MSAFGGKADMTVCGSPLSWSLLGLKQTCRLALQMSAFDPKRTLAVLISDPFQSGRLNSGFIFVFAQRAGPPAAATGYKCARSSVVFTLRSVSKRLERCS